MSTGTKRRPSLKRLLSDQSGAAALMLGLAAFPIMMAVGMAVDHGNAVRIQTRLQLAADAAALAAGRKAGSNASELQAIANKYFFANWHGTIGSGTPTLSLVNTVSTVTVNAQVPVENYFTKVAGFDSKILRTSSTVTKEANGLEVVLVFDNTGSMANLSRLPTLKVAAQDFVNILFGDRETAEQLKISVVPFAATVNIGTATSNTNWLDTTGASAASRHNFNNSSWHNWRAWQTIPNRTWNGCVEMRDINFEFTDAPPSAGVPGTLFPPYFAPDEPGNNAATTYLMSNGNNGSSSSHNYRYYNSYLTDSGSGSIDARQRHPNKYSSSVSGTDRGPDWGCGITAITPLTNSRSTVITAINAMQANGATAIASGVMWGLRAISPGEPFSQGVAYDNPEKIKKAMILLTDGENDVGSNGSALPNHHLTWYNAFGYAAQGRLGSSATSFSSFRTALDQRTRAACDLVKDPDGDGEEEVVIYAFAYQAPASGKSLMQYCASDPEKFFDPPTNAALVQNFQQIADELRNLYLSR